MTSNPVGVSIVIPAFNAATTIGRALKSVESQIRAPDEVIIVDDGSSDDTCLIVESFEASLPIILIQQQNQGAGAARNRALNVARFSHIAFLDADDEWLPDHLRRSLEELAAGDHVLVAHNEWISENGIEKLNDCAQRFKEPRDPYVTLFRKGYISTSTVVVGRQDILACGGFDTSLKNAQDFDLWLSLLSDRSKSFLVFDDVLARYHIVDNSIMSHVDRRVGCCRKIALRHNGHISGSRFRQLTELALRGLIVYREAFNAHQKNRLWGHALLCLFVCPFSMVTDMLSAIFFRLDARKSHVILIWFLWLWVLVGICTYLYQFRHFAQPIWHLLKGLF